MILSESLWKMRHYKQRITKKQWAKALLDHEDESFIDGERLDFQARDLGAGIVEISRVQPAPHPDTPKNVPINIVFDGPPGPESGRFVEVETDDGASILCGEWIERLDGFWALRITDFPKVLEVKA